MKIQRNPVKVSRKTKMRVSEWFSLSPKTGRRRDTWTDDRQDPKSESGKTLMGKGEDTGDRRHWVFCIWKRVVVRTESQTESNLVSEKMRL